MIKSIDKSSVHRITSGQVLVDLQTAVKELVENSLDAGATTIDVKFRDYGLASFEVSDNGSGISPEDYDNVAMKHYTSKISTFEDLTTVQTFGFRGEALSSLCALSDRVTITTATAKEAPMGTILEFDKTGSVKSRSGKAARQRGTTVLVEGLFVPLPVRRKEFQRNSKREFGKALNILSAYALVPCANENKGVRLSVVHILDKGRKSDQIRTDGKPSLKASISSLWGPKQFESLSELELDLKVAPEKTVLRRQANKDHDGSATQIKVRGYISKFSHGHGRVGPDRQFFYVNGRPCTPSRIQKAFNEVYRSFNANQSPFVVADFIVPTNSIDINVSPDKRTILLHSENSLVTALKEELENTFAPTRSTFVVQPTQSKLGTPKSGKSTNAGLGKADVTESHSQDTSVGLSSSSSKDTGVETDETVEPPVMRSPTPSLTVPAALLADEEQQAAPSERTSQVTDESQNRSPSTSLSQLHKRASDSSTPIDQLKPRPSRSAPSVPSRSTTPAVHSGTNSRPVQMVLDTTGVGWVIRHGSEDPVRKKRRLEEGKNENSRTRLRAQILRFAPVGSHPEKMYESDEEVDGGDLNMDSAEKMKQISEEDELMEEELDEIREDAEADLAGPSFVEGTRQRLSDNTDGGVGGNTLFLPDPELREPGIYTHAKVEPIEIDLAMDDNGSDAKSTVNTSRTSGRKASGGARSSSSKRNESTSESGTTGGLEVARTVGLNDDISVPFSIQRVDLVWDTLGSKSTSVPTSSTSTSQKQSIKLVDPSAGLSNTSDEESAQRELARVIDKDDFASMDIIGQFNLGFIIARRRLHESSGSSTSTDLDDLFIIDQHAADEKYNYETLQETTKIDSQKLYRPRPLELTAADELLALENIDVLKNNGFEIIVDEDAEPSQGRIKLVAQPVSGSTDFNMKDLEELLHLIQDRPSAQKMVRCSKARAMFAMRACRKSAMIGTALNNSQMVLIVRHMGTMDQPWNCPHGRPTMRHLTSLTDAAVGSCPSAGASSRPIKWNDL